MQRKLIGLSTSTTVISLPSKWIKQQELNKGDIISLEEVEGSIIINPLSQQKKETTINITTIKKKHTWYLVDAAYCAGYDTIHIITKNLEQRKLLNTIVRYFPGMIIEKEQGKTITFQDISSIKEVNAEKLFRRIFHMIGNLLEEFIEFAKTKNFSELKDLKRKDYTINTYLSLFLRYIAKKGYTSFRKSGEVHTYLKMLELFSDRLCELAQHMGEEKNSTPKQIELLKNIQLLYKELETQHFKKDKNISKLDDMRIETEKKIKASTPHKHQFSDLLSLINELEQLELIHNI